MPVVVPWTDAPTVSVLIVVYGGGELVADAVASLVDHTTVPFEVIVVDNASPDDSVDRIRDGVAGIKLIEEDRNLGFGGGNNRAAQEARAPIICLLNPDARVTPGWLDPLLALLDDPRVGAVAPALLHADGTLQEAGAMVDHWGYTAPLGTREFGDPVPMPEGRVAVDYASAACLLMRTDVFRELEGFDPAYRLAYFEDVDLGMRVWEQGLQVWVEPASRVVHLGGGMVTKVVSQALWHHNHSVFLHRWRAELLRRPSLVMGTQEDIARLWSWRMRQSKMKPMSASTPESEFIDELGADIEAYIQRCSMLTEFAEDQVQERIRLTRAIEHLQKDRAGHLRTIEELDKRLQAVEGSKMVRVALLPRRVWRKLRRSPS